MTDRMAGRLRQLATAPLTTRQLGAIHGEFRRLGCRDRGERLAITATLARTGPVRLTWS